MSRLRRGARLCALALLVFPAACRSTPAAELPRHARPEAGRFLVASRQVGGPVFAETIVLLVEKNDAGALGLIVNRPTSIPLSEIFPDVGPKSAQRAYLGGPVAIGTIRALLRADRAPAASARVTDEIFISSSAPVVHEALAAADAGRRVRAYLGYAGWAPGQLEDEIARGDWFVAVAEADAVFSDRPEALWDELIRAHEAVRTERDPGGASHGPLASASHGTSW
jgi:putative transcriptional regulator